MNRFVISNRLSTKSSILSQRIGIFDKTRIQSARNFLSRYETIVSMSSSAHQKTEEEWRAVLSPEQFRILRQKGTEPAYSGEYDKFFGKGIYHCAGCGTPLFKSDAKFNSGCGWPAFFDTLPGSSLHICHILIVFMVLVVVGAVNRHPDPSIPGRPRVEITCAKCGGHLGHVFQGEGKLISYCF